MRVAIAALLTILSLPVLASPDCSNPGPKPSAECVTKIDYCKYTSIVVVLSYRARLDGKSEAAAFAAPSTNEPAWYARNPDVVKDIGPPDVHDRLFSEAQDADRADRPRPGASDRRAHTRLPREHQSRRGVALTRRRAAPSARARTPVAVNSPRRRGARRGAPRQQLCNEASTLTTDCGSIQCTVTVIHG